MRLRRARPEDLEAVGDVTVAAYARPRSGVATPDDSAEILGTVTICPEGSPWRQVAEPGEGEFRMLAVAPEARGQGVGAALLHLVVKRFRAEGAPRIVMSTQPDMRAARHIYEAAGFVRAPDRDWSPVPGVDLITYLLELS